MGLRRDRGLNSRKTQSSKIITLHLLKAESLVKFTITAYNSIKAGRTVLRVRDKKSLFNLALTSCVTAAQRG